MQHDTDAYPLFGCITGFTLPEESFELAAGVSLHRGYFDVFSAPMMAFGPPIAPALHNPAPWMAVRGGMTSFSSRVELRIEELETFNPLPSSTVAWLVAALFRLRVSAPVRVPAVANIPLRKLADIPGANATSFEGGQHQVGWFRQGLLEATTEELLWVKMVLPRAVSLYHHDRFMRAFSIFDDASWSSRFELATTLIWTAVEILFDKSATQHKAKEIASALSDFVAHSPSDRDKAYNVIRDLYEKRGRVVHVGSKIDPNDYGQSLALARAAFVNVLTRDELPPSHKSKKH